jgi:hypothetical protein
MFGEEMVKTAAVIGTELPPDMVQSLERAGYTIDSKATEFSILFIGGRLDDKNVAKTILDAVQHSKTIVIDIRTATQFAPELNPILPFNDWSIKDQRLCRNNIALNFKEPISFENAYDLHLPGASIENSQHRYLYRDYEKPLNNSDWRIIAFTRNRMPILIAGRTGNAGIYVLGARWNDPALVNSPGAKFFFDAIIKKIIQPLDISQKLTETVEISIPEFQSDGLYICAKNTTTKSVRFALGYQITNWEREILNVKTLEIELKPEEMKQIPLQERGTFKGQPDIAELGSRLPYRRIRAGILSSDRLSVTNEIRRNILVAPPVSISLVENGNNWYDEAFYEEIDNGADGTVAKRFIQPTGTMSELTIQVNNRFVNIAPLAEPRDEKTPDNPTIEGLNDLSYSRANVRQDGKMQGGWCGGVLPEQNVSLTWSDSVFVSGIGLEVYGQERLEDRTQPKNLILKTKNQILFQQDHPVYITNGSRMYARYFETFPTTGTKRLDMVMTKFHQQGVGRINLGATNCSIKELEIYGWTVEDKTVTDGELELTSYDCVTGKSTLLKKEQLSIPAGSRKEITVQIPACSEFKPIRYDIIYRQNGKTLAQTQYDVLYIPPNRLSILNKKSLYDWDVGLLCTPGWVQNGGDFGLGMLDWTQGWGGVHDKIWALVHGVMETDYRTIDQPARMLTTNTRNSHYTNPWRYLPDGSYGWNLMIQGLLKKAETRKVKRLWVIGSDRWNGIPIGHTFGWDMFVRFDRFLRDQGGEGLKSRSRKGISNEIMTQYADQWQQWHLEEYAKKITETKNLFAEHGIKWMFETHGSFPFVGGEIGDRLGETHAGVGTDLFWELRRQDLYWSLATRFAVIAANPNLSSGMYKQWGWVNSESNKFWFANNAPVEPARRQWYGTYFMGRVNSAGTFLPYHVFGYSLQGGVSTKFYQHEIENSLRTFNFTRFVRPEQPAGYGFIVSWDSHLRRMTTQGGSMGFGLYATGGEKNQLDYRMGNLYETLIKNGLPIGFVSSSYAIRNWNGTNPLILLDASDWQGTELETVTKLWKSGTPIVGFGGLDQSSTTLKFWTDGAEKFNVGTIEFFVRKNQNGIPFIYCPFNDNKLSATDIPVLINTLMNLCGLNITITPQLIVNPFINNDALFLGLGTLSDQNVTAKIHLDPGQWNAALKDTKVKVIDLEHFQNIVPDTDGSYTFPLPAVSGKMLLIMKGE